LDSREAKEFAGMVGHWGKRREGKKAPLKRKGKEDPSAGEMTFKASGKINALQEGIKTRSISKESQSQMKSKPATPGNWKTWKGKKALSGKKKKKKSEPSSLEEYASFTTNHHLKERTTGKKKSANVVKRDKNMPYRKVLHLP